jgi:hypothetical protein
MSFSIVLSKSREILMWEIEVLQALLATVVKPPLLGAIISLFWRYDSFGTFSVKSAYLLLMDGAVFNVLNSLLTRVWKSWVLSKVIVFFWQLLQNRVPTRQNLPKHRVIRDLVMLYALSVELRWKR